MRITAPLAASALASLALAGCSTMPRERPEPPPLPTAWQDAPQAAAAPVTDWWREFNDPSLDYLVNQALTQGPSVELAVLRLREARALSSTTITRYLPELSATGQGQYSRTVSGQSSSAIPGVTAERESMSAAYGASVSWEIPLFSRIEAAVRGSRANTASAVADVRAAQVALAADVAQAYVDLRAAQQTREALARSVDTADELARILAISTNAGVTSEADAADARRLAESTRARLPGLVIETRRAENVLATLRGVAPGTEDQAVRTVLAQTAPVPHPVITAAPAAPADLVRLRPDVVRAEAQALLAAANVANARSDLLPQLNLSGAITSTEAVIGSPLGAGSTVVSATPFISIPLFDWGERFAAIRQRNAQFDQSLLQYRQTVVLAVGEASNALAGLDQGRLRLNSARIAEEAAETTARGSRAAYGAGIQSLTDRLRSEQQLIDSTVTRIDAEAQLARAAINTYRAFGGGPAIAPANASTASR